MLVFHSPLSLLHDPPHEILSGCVQPYFESPDRYHRILAALVSGSTSDSASLGTTARWTAEERRLEWSRDEVLTPDLDRAVRAVHDGAYLDFLATIYAEWVAEGGSRVRPCSHLLLCSALRVLMLETHSMQRCQNRSCAPTCSSSRATAPRAKEAPSPASVRPSPLCAPS